MVWGWELWVGTYIVTNYPLPDGTWQLKKLFREIVKSRAFRTFHKNLGFSKFLPILFPTFSQTLHDHLGEKKNTKFVLNVLNALDLVISQPFL